MKLHVRDDLARLEALLEHKPLWQRVIAIALACVVHGVVYFFGNHFPSSEPRLLHSTALDEAIPFLPWTAVVYVSAYVQAIAAFLTLKRFIDLQHFLEIFTVTVLVAGLIHWALPTRFPRELFPLDAGDPSTLLLRWVRLVDTPASCFPSLHVGLAFSCSFAIRQPRPRLWWAFFAWSVAIALSTLTTKQHYLVDVAGGLLLSVVCVAVVERFNARLAARLTPELES